MIRPFVTFLLIVTALSLSSALAANLIFVGEVRQRLAAAIPPEPPEDATGSFHLGVMVTPGNDRFREALLAGIRDEASLSDIVIQPFLMEGEEKSREFLRGVTAGLDGVILLLDPGEAALPYQQQAVAAGVHLVTVGLERPQDYTRGFVGSSSFQQGVESGKIAGQLWGSSLRAAVLLPWDPEGFWEDDPFFQGIKTALSSFPGARIFGVRRPSEGLFSGEAAASAVLGTQRSLNLLICPTDVDTEGAMQAVLEANLTGRVSIVGADSSGAIVRGLEKGIIAAVVQRDADTLGRMAVQEFLRRTQGLPPSPAKEVPFHVLWGEKAP